MSEDGNRTQPFDTLTKEQVLDLFEEIEIGSEFVQTLKLIDQDEDHLVYHVQFFDPALQTVIITVQASSSPRWYEEPEESVGG